MNKPLTILETETELQEEGKILPYAYPSTKRSSIEICMELLRYVADSETNNNEPVMKSRLFYSASISHQSGEVHLEILTKRGLVFEESLDRRRVYRVTQNGLKVLELYRSLTDLQKGIQDDV
jgi:predicted transcriptional regulator